MLLTKGQAEVPVFQIWNQPFKTLRVYDKNKVFDCLGTLKDYEKRYPNLVPADRQSLINLDAVQNYDKKGASPILIKALPIPLPSVAGGLSC